jgi:hypothetical protein
VFNGSVDIIASGADTIDDSKYSVSKNTSTGLYYKLHILNVGVSDIKKYRCSGPVQGGIQYFYLQLILIGRCKYILVIFKWKTEKVVWTGECIMVVVGIMKHLVVRYV